MTKGRADLTTKTPKTPRDQSPDETNGGSRRANNDAPLVVLDLGGDPAGAKVMASIAEGMRPEDLFGPFRAELAAAVHGSGFGGAGDDGRDRERGEDQGGPIVVNSHLIDETTPDVINEGIELAEALAGRAAPVSHLSRFSASCLSALTPASAATR